MDGQAGYDVGGLRTSITSSDDLNDYNGYYCLTIGSQSVANSVSNTPFKAAMLVISIPYLGSTSCIQFAFNPTYGEYIRYYTSGGWSAWRKNTTT